MAARRGGRARRSPTCSTGDVNPGGKLPISYPRSVGQIPVYYGHKVSGGRSHWKGDYVDAPAAPLYPFGHGLELHDVRPQRRRRSPATRCRGTTRSRRRSRVTNTGDRAGDEVVQLYVRDPSASVTRPVLELKGFVRVEPWPPASRGRVTFATPVGQLGFYDRDLAYVVEPGEIDVFVGTSSVDLVEAGTVTVVADSTGPPDQTLRRHRHRRVTD